MTARSTAYRRRRRSILPRTESADRTAVLSHDIYQYTAYLQNRIHTESRRRIQFRQRDYICYITVTSA